MLLNLSDLFTPESNFIKTLSDYCINDLGKQNAGLVVNGELEELKASDLKMFVGSPRGITFTFAPYAVGSYVEGSYFVLVGYGELESIINPKGPLKQFLK